MEKLNILTIISIIIVGSLKLQIGFSQSVVLKERSSYFLPIKDDSMSYTTYPLNYILEGIYTNISQSKNEFPEETLMSILSANSYEWDSQNYNYAIKNSTDKYKKASKNLLKPKVELQRKLIFEANNTTYAVIKYYIIENSEKTPSSFIFMKKSNKWVVTDEIGLSKIDLIFSYLSNKTLDAIFLNQKTGVDSFDKQLTNCYQKGVLNLNKYLSSTPKNDNTENELKVIIEPFYLKK